MYQGLVFLESGNQSPDIYFLAYKMGYKVADAGGGGKIFFLKESFLQ